MSAAQNPSQSLALAEMMAGRTRPSDAATQALQHYLSKPSSERFEALFPHIRPPVHLGVNRALLPVRLFCSYARDDLEQDVYLHLISHNARVLRQFRPRKGSLQRFVRGIAYDKASDRIRRCENPLPLDGDLEAALRTRPIDAVEHRDTVLKLVHYLETTAHNGGPQAVLQALIKGDALRSVAKQTGLSAKYLDKCACELRKRARDWRLAQIRDDEHPAYEAPPVTSGASA